MPIITSLVAQISAYTSLIGLYLTVLPPGSDRPEWHWLIIGIFLVLSALAIYKELSNSQRGKPRVFKNTEGINEYMSQWVSSPGRTVIFSRDLSWGANIGARLALRKKAESGNLTICLHHATPLSDSLKELGANIVIYGDSKHEPRSRFTIVGYGMDGSRVALGVQRGSEHVVYEYGIGEHPTFALAEDLARIIAGLKGDTDAV